MHPQTGATSIDEDQLLRFLVNHLDQTLPLDLGDNASIDTAELWSILVGACANDSSVSQVCKSSAGSPHENSVLYHLRSNLDPTAVEQDGNHLLRRLTHDVLPETIEAVIDLHLRPYYGNEGETDGLYHSQARAGTTAFHAYATLYARVRNKRFTLGFVALSMGRRRATSSPSSSESSTGWTRTFGRSTSTGSSTTASASRSSRPTISPM